MEAVKGTKRTTKSYDTSAEVVRVDGATLWVHIPGGVAETPVKKTINARAGDSVQVRVSGGRAFLVGNATAPPTDDAKANAAQLTANTAAQSAAVAYSAASDAQSDANAAARAADEAQSSADAANTAARAAQSSADAANTAARTAQSSADAANTAAQTAQTSADTAGDAAISALTQLSVVEDVVGVLNWISEHGTYSLTSDTEAAHGKMYFTRTGSGTDADPYVYTLVTSPASNPQAAGYYELTSVDEAVANYVSTHLALLNDGLYIVGSVNGWKVLVSSGDGSYPAGFYLIDPNGSVAQLINASLISIGAQSNSAVIQFCGGTLELTCREGYASLQPGGAYDPEPGEIYGLDIALWSRVRATSGYRVGIYIGSEDMTLYGGLTIPVYGIGGVTGYNRIMKSNGELSNIAKRIFKAVSISFVNTRAKTAVIAEWLTGDDALYAQRSAASSTEIPEPDVTPEDVEYDLRVGDIALVQFTGGNTASTPTLNINETGAKPIRSQIGAAWTASSNWSKATIIPVVYTGEYWLMLNTNL